jgi:molybdopterin synthase sulfur carrier subunit
VSVTIRIPTPLHRFTAGVSSVQTAARDLGELFEHLEQRFPGIKQALTKPDGTPHQFLSIFVNDEDIRFLGGLRYTFQDGDEVVLIPAIAGGSWAL